VSKISKNLAVFHSNFETPAGQQAEGNGNQLANQSNFGSVANFPQCCTQSSLQDRTVTKVKVEEKSHGCINNANRKINDTGTKDDKRSPPLAMPLLSSIKQSTMVKAVITIPMHIHTLAHSGTVVNDKGSNILFFRHGRVGFWFLV
jgi:hypothetical protein